MINPRFEKTTSFGHIFSKTMLGMVKHLKKVQNMLSSSANITVNSEGQEKYLRELSITPVGYFTGAGAIKNHSRAVSHGNYFAWRK
jgi:hypothetical protein